ncbi:hypothetical protein AAHA92_33438 [Salvia divinorum]|uniref:K-box domain-containing protein n=1 Tax=Salvia divinorum TaxID=28513 RepID=A0ABD1FP08_SALDI
MKRIVKFRIPSLSATIELHPKILNFKGKSIRFEELVEFEHQLELSLNKVRARKVQLIQEQAENLKRMEALTEKENQGMYHSSIKYFCFDEVELKDDTDLDLEELGFQGNCLHKDIPIFAGFFCVGDAMFMVGGMLYSVPTPISRKQITKTNCLLFAPLSRDSSPVTWTRSPTSMDLV